MLFSLILKAATSKKSVWNVPTAPYHNPPPPPPYEYARVQEVRSVDAWVQLETIPAAIMPGLTDHETALDSSADLKVL